MRFDEGSLKELFEPVIESLGFEYWGLELLNHGRNLKIRLYIEAEAGVGIDDCVLVSEHISDLLDVEADFASIIDSKSLRQEWTEYCFVKTTTPGMSENVLN